MNLQQLRYLCAIVDNNLNVSEAADSLFTSQPGVSKQVRQLEDELGVRVFVRAGKRLASITPAGEAVVSAARRALKEIENLKRVGAEYKSEDEGTLAIATTHTQARYVIPRVLRDFAEHYPKLKGRTGKSMQVDTDRERRRRRRHRDEALASFPISSPFLLPVEPLLVARPSAG
jgi:LysR family cys regulon transcriptional activator